MYITGRNTKFTYVGYIKKDQQLSNGTIYVDLLSDALAIISKNHGVPYSKWASLRVFKDGELCLLNPPEDDRKNSNPPPPTTVKPPPPPNPPPATALALVPKREHREIYVMFGNISVKEG